VKALDNYLRDVRIAKAEPFVGRGDVVVDVGCADGTMFERWGETIEYGYGVDPTLAQKREAPGYVLYPGHFPDALPAVKCDLITMLAVLEHIPPDEQAKLGERCHEMLNPARLRLVDGMSLEEHYGFEPEDTLGVFPPPLFRLLRRRRFQLGLNNLFVFERAD
jgi:hypothetical protein